MTISTKGRYGLSFMLDVIENQEVDAVRLKDSAERQNISEKYLEQIARTLTKGGLLQGSRGVHGGYRLVRKPEEYTVGEVLYLLEGDLAPAPCVSGNEHSCDRRKECANAVLWKKIDDAVHSVVDNITLADMVEWKKTAR